MTAEKGARIRKAIGGSPLVAAVVVACLALTTQGCAGARGMGTSNTAINYVTILGSGPEMQPSCCVSTSKVICRYRVSWGLCLAARMGGWQGVAGAPVRVTMHARGRRRSSFSTARKARSG